MPDNMGKPIGEFSIDDEAELDHISEFIRYLEEEGEYHVDTEWSKGKINVGKRVNASIQVEE